MRAKEADCQAAIIEAAKLAGWRVHAERASKTGNRWMTAIQGDAGFPDLVLVRPPRILVVELKRKPYKVSPEQHDWLEQLAKCGVETRIVWVPEGQDEFIKELTQR